MPIAVQDRPLEVTSSAILAAVKAIPSINVASIVQALDAINTSLQQQTTLLQEIATAVAVKVPTTGMFNPPVDLLKIKPVEVIMSVMQLEVGQTAVGKLTFDEPNPPADGAVASDNASVATIALSTDLETWTCVAMAVGVANVSYTGTSASPDVGAAIVPNMVVTVVAVPVAEHGDFDPTAAVITGP